MAEGLSQFYKYSDNWNCNKYQWVVFLQWWLVPGGESLHFKFFGTLWEALALWGLERSIKCVISRRICSSKWMKRGRSGCRTGALHAERMAGGWGRGRGSQTHPPHPPGTGAAVPPGSGVIWMELSRTQWAQCSPCPPAPPILTRPFVELQGAGWKAAWLLLSNSRFNFRVQCNELGWDQ